MTEEQREALRSLFAQEYRSSLETGLAVAQLVGCAVIPTKEIMWFEPGEVPVKVAELQGIEGKYKWMEVVK